MDPVAIAALVLSVISILLWAYTFLFPKNKLSLSGKSTGSSAATEEKDAEPGMPVPVRSNSQVQTPPHGKQSSQETNFMGDTQKFSQMVRKNLEMLNTRVGIKFDVKPLSEEYAARKKEPSYIDSMDVTEEKTDNYLTDESESTD